MGRPWTNLSAAPTAVANGLVASVAMKVGAYTLAANNAPSGARHVTCTRTVVGGADTAGTLLVTGTDLSGQVITETLTPGATGVLVTGTKFFATVTDVTGAGWATATGDDTIVVGWDAQCAVATGSGTLYAIVVNTTAAGTVTVTDGRGQMAVLKSSIAEGSYFYGDEGIAFSGFLRVELGAASNVTVIHSGSVPGSYAMA
jgi:hypothetical protein